MVTTQSGRAEDVPSCSERSVTGRITLDAKHTSVEVIEREVGRWNTDIALGWEAGLKGKERPHGRRLFDRQAPDHFYEKQNHTRLMDWLLGQKNGARYRELNLYRKVHYVGENAAGTVNGAYKGWGIKRGRVVSMLIGKHGCFGDVYFYYFEGTEIVRTHKCGI